MALNIFLNGLHDCHDFHCFIMSFQELINQVKDIVSGIAELNYSEIS